MAIRMATPITISASSLFQFPKLAFAKCCNNRAGLYNLLPKMGQFLHMCASSLRGATERKKNKNAKDIKENVFAAFHQTNTNQRNK